jgi:hypothetical protein
MELAQLEKELMEKAGWLVTKLSEQKQLVKDYAHAEEAYRVALASKMIELKLEGEKVTILSDIARGDKTVAGLKRDRDIAKGVSDACKSSIHSLQSTMSGIQSLISAKKAEINIDMIS